MDNYNTLKAQFKDIMNDFENQTNESRQGYTAGIKKKLGELLKNIQSGMNEVQQKRTALFFPKASSKVKELNELGLIEEQTANNFLSIQQTLEAIVNKLKQCFDLGQIDYASIIFQKLRSQIPKSESEWERLPKEKIELFRAVERMYKQFTSRQGIDLFENELKLISNLEQRTLELTQSIK